METAVHRQLYGIDGLNISWAGREKNIRKSERYPYIRQMVISSEEMTI